MFGPNIQVCLFIGVYSAHINNYQLSSFINFRNETGVSDVKYCVIEI